MGPLFLYPTFSITFSVGFIPRKLPPTPIHFSFSLLCVFLLLSLHKDNVFLSLMLLLSFLSIILPYIEIYCTNVWYQSMSTLVILELHGNLGKWGFVTFFFLLYMYNFVLYQIFKGNNHNNFEHNGINLSIKIKCVGCAPKIFKKNVLKKKFSFWFYYKKISKNIKYN